MVENSGTGGFFVGGAEGCERLGGADVGLGADFGALSGLHACVVVALPCALAGLAESGLGLLSMDWAEDDEVGLALVRWMVVSEVIVGLTVCVDKTLPSPFTGLAESGRGMVTL